MKTHIDPTQLAQLTDRGQARLRAWWTPQHGDLVHCLELHNTHFFSFHSLYDYYKDEYLPLLSVQQIIALLGEDWPLTLPRDKITSALSDPDQFCDLLWDSAKVYLETEPFAPAAPSAAATLDLH